MAITSVEIGALTSVPVLGSILGMVEQWLISQLEDIVFAKCDGLVAVEQVVLLGRDLHLMTANGSLSCVGSSGHRLCHRMWKQLQVRSNVVHHACLMFSHGCVRDSPDAANNFALI
jgi:hypothetical protein